MFATGFFSIFDSVSGGRCWPGDLLEYDVVDSTNTRALGLVDSGLGDDFAVSARMQTAGRGRLGRAWFSPKDMGIYCSVALRPRAAMERWPQLTLVMAVAAVAAVKEVAAVDLEIKWPNDLYWHGRKAGGILAEIKPGAEGKGDAVVVGIGLNLGQRARDFPGELSDSACSLALADGEHAAHHELVRALLDSFHAWRREWEEKGFAGVRNNWLANDCSIGKWVTLPGSDRKRVRVEGMDEAGDLLVRAESGEATRLIADDIVLGRPAT